MEQRLGRFRFTSPIKFRDKAGEEEFMSSLNEDEKGEPVPAAVAEILAVAKEKLRELGFDVSIEIKPVEKTTTAIQDFAAASEKRHNPELAAARAQIGDTARMSPTQRFRALSNLRWGIR